MRIECPHCSAKLRFDEPPDDDTPIRCTECKKKFTPDLDDDRPAKKGGKKRKRAGEGEEENGNKTVQWAIAGGVVVVAAVVAVVVLVMTRDTGTKPALKSGEVAVANPPGPLFPPPAPTPPAPPPDNTPSGPAKITGLPPINQTPKNGGVIVNPVEKGPVQVVEGFGPYAELFKTPVSAPPRTVKAATLRPTDTDKVPEVPTFHSLMLARKGAPAATAVVPKTAKMTNDEVKKACAFIKVMGTDRMNFGSGFLIGQDGTAGLVATNYHVIQNAARPRYGAQRPGVTAVFNSGLADERSGKASIIAYDTFADVAILRVEGNGLPWPKPISPYNALPKLVEGVPINFWGFPLGIKLAGGANRNPEITLGKGNVSSLRHSASGKLDKVQISGTMNPGNSGGPLVDDDGRLVGIAVSIIKPEEGTGIGFAVPVNDLIALLEGRLVTTEFIPTGLEGGKAKFLVFVPVMDPLDRIDTVFLRRWSGFGKGPEAVKDALTGFRPFGIQKDGKANLPGVDEFRLEKFRTEGGSASGLGIALGEMDVPLDSGQVMIQVASRTTPQPQTGVLTAASKPVAYSLVVADQAVGADARPFTELTTNPDALAGKVVVVKAHVAAPPTTLDLVQDFVVTDDNGQRPDRMRFVVDRPTAVQFDEVIPEHQPLPVRLVCLVGARGADGIVPVRVARLDFIGRADRVVRTIPASPDPQDKLAALNRDPAGFAGKTVVFDVPGVVLVEQLLFAGEVLVALPSFAIPRNLDFHVGPAMRQQLLNMLDPSSTFGATIPARITVVVPPGGVVPRQRVRLTVTKIELTDRDGKVVRTIQ